jgi:hypothetical protein
MFVDKMICKETLREWSAFERIDPNIVVIAGSSYKSWQIDQNVENVNK